MTRFGKLQLFGPAALILAVICAEGAAYGLAHFPSSEWLWYLNLKWFGMFQQSHYALNSSLGVDCEQLLFVAMPLSAAALIGVIFKRSLLVAISSDLSFVYIAFVVYTWWRAKTSAAEASLNFQYVGSSGPDTILLLILVTVSLVSFVVSHILYIQKARAPA